MSTDTADRTDEAIIDVSPAALEKVLEIRAAEDDGDELALRIEVTGTQGVDYSYDLAFEPMAEAADDDARFTSGELDLLVPANSIDLLRGATLDLPSNPAQGGLVIRNPNRPDPMAGLADLELTGDTAEKVSQLLDQAINPSLAAHGGFATLVGVDDTKVYVTMGGGCQGCSMSALTLSEGIKTQILETIPEVTDVIDATDHSAGENPFYS
jgi:Fe/S biogenesis protein NfuA